jgi:hypothetical protein
MPTDLDGVPSGRTRFRRTLVRVMTMQIIALVLLALLQLRYGGA